MLGARGQDERLKIVRQPCGGRQRDGGAHRRLSRRTGRGPAGWRRAIFRPASIYAEAITQAMRDCSACAVILSAAANASDAIKRELELASHYRKPFIPIRADSSEPGPGLDYYLRNTQWIEYRAEGERALDRIVRSTRAGAPRAAPSPRNFRPRRANPTAPMLIVAALHSRGRGRRLLFLARRQHRPAAGRRTTDDACRTNRRRSPAPAKRKPPRSPSSATMRSPPPRPTGANSPKSKHAANAPSARRQRQPPALQTSRPRRRRVRPSIRSAASGTRSSSTAGAAPWTRRGDQGKPPRQRNPRNHRARRSGHHRAHATARPMHLYRRHGWQPSLRQRVVYLRLGPRAGQRLERDDRAVKACCI